jgi:iron-sulfur cluster assembly protein
MICISDRAVEKVAKLLLQGGLEENYFLRIGIVGGGCSGLSYKLDLDNELQPEDRVFEHGSIRIATDKNSYLYLCGATLDYCPGKGFYFINPNAGPACGCGESFSV